MSESIFATNRFLSGTYESQLDQVLELRGQSSYICFCNAHMVYEAQISDQFNNVLSSADLLACDGVPVLWAERYLAAKQIDRFAGMDVIEDVFAKSSTEGYRVFLYGGTPDALEAVASEANRQYPGCNIVGAISPPFREMTKPELEEIYDQINTAQADFVLVALGCPKQERWMFEARGKVNACMLGVGAAFATFGGQIDMAPSWMRDNGVEWIYRLAKEPRRLFKRYLIGNSVFVYVFLKHLFKRVAGA